ncbi:hypothetical protein ACE1SV_53260 [Streptomyces sennicomposti]
MRHPSDHRSRPLRVRSVVPDVRSREFEENARCHGLPGLEEAMNHGWIVTLAPAAGPAAQISAWTRI